MLCFNMDQQYIMMQDIWAISTFQIMFWINK